MSNEIAAVFPLSDTQVVLIFPDAVDLSGTVEPDLFRFRSGIGVRGVRSFDERRQSLVLDVETMAALPMTVDQVSASKLRGRDGRPLGDVVSPLFIHAIQSPTELRPLHFEGKFPFTSTLVGHHVSVMCCTGCNGGVHDRGLVVLNNHVGGGWSSIWIRTDKTIDVPYPRWQRVLFAGGVIEEEGGSTVVVDRGWMVVKKTDEVAHHAPPALSLRSVDLPLDQTPSLLCKGLDAAWVQFENVLVESADRVPAVESQSNTTQLARTEIVISDNSGGRSVAWLYQRSAEGFKGGERIRVLRGFVHAEEPGRYVVLSDKEEDLIGVS